VIAERCSGLQARAYKNGETVWSAAQFEKAIADDDAVFVHCEDGFALGRVISSEAELFAVAVEPSASRKGTGSTLLSDFLTQCRNRRAEQVFLEVSVGNAPAIAFYIKHGFRRIGQRREYYATPQGKLDALVLRRDLFHASRH